MRAAFTAMAAVAGMFLTTAIIRGLCWLNGLEVSAPGPFFIVFLSVLAGPFIGVFAHEHAEPVVRWIEQRTRRARQVVVSDTKEPTP